MNTEEINRIIKLINKSLKEEDMYFKAEIVLDPDIENLIIGEG